MTTRRRPRSIFYWEAKERLRTLEQFRDDVEAFFQQAHWNPEEDWVQDDGAKALRRRINERLREAEVACYFVGVGQPLDYAPPPAVGGLAGQVDLFRNIFNFPRLRLPIELLTDELDRAIGIYRSWLGPLWRKLFNPFYWIGRLLEAISRIPFRILASAGFDLDKAEGSLLGKIVSAIIQFAVALAAIIKGASSLLEYIGGLGF